MSTYMMGNPFKNVGSLSALLHRVRECMMGVSAQKPEHTSNLDTSLRSQGQSLKETTIWQKAQDSQ
jgi:hypothetical protein